MTYILHTMRDQLNLKEITGAYKRYNEYLESMRDKFPAAAFKFATAPWHYNPQDPRCLHDAWLEHLNMNELAPEQQDIQHRVVDIHVRLLAAYYDGHIELVYKSVWAYPFTKYVREWRNERINKVAEIG